MQVTVVGAGIIGCAIAHELASRGAAVRLIDPRGVGQGATRASAGILAPHIEGHLPPLHTLGVRSLARYDRFIARIESDAGRPIEYERSGTLQVALTSDERAALCASSRLLRDAGVAHTMLEASEARRQEPGLPETIAGGLLIPDQGYVTVGALNGALADAAVRRGAELSTARVLGIEGGSAPRVTTADGTVSGDAVVLAAGSWSSAIEAGGRAVPAVKPIRGQLLLLRAAERPASRVVWGADCYIVPWRDGSTLVGATVEDVGFDESSTAAAVHDLLAAARQLLPGLGAAAFAEVRVGLRPMTRDELPAIGRSSTQPGVVYATGHYRNGVLLAPLTAALVADLVLEDREGPELALVRPDRLGL